MAEVVVVPAEDQGDAEAVALAAGAALATAEQAHDTAQGAEAVAEVAAEQAAVAAEVAGAATAEAFDARAAVEGLRADFTSFLEQWRATQTPAAEAEPVDELAADEDEDVAPAPEAKAKKDPAPKEDDGEKETTPKTAGYGNSRWFGGR